MRLLVAADAAVSAAIDDTLFARRGPKVHAASWFHDGSATGEKKIAYGNCADLLVMPTSGAGRLWGKGSAPVRLA